MVRLPVSAIREWAGEPDKHYRPRIHSVDPYGDGIPILPLTKRELEGVIHTFGYKPLYGAKLYHFSKMSVH